MHTGTVPPGWGVPESSLTVLRAAFNELHGTLPPAWSFPKLTTMILDRNSLTGWPAQRCAGHPIHAACLTGCFWRKLPRLDAVKSFHLVICIRCFGCLMFG